MKKISILLFLLFPFLMKAQGFQVNLQGQKQQAMGGAGSAVALDGASIFFNPGGVSFLKESSINLGASATIGSTAFLDANTNRLSRTKSPISFPFTGYAVMGKTDGKLKFGLGAYTPFGSTVKWEDGWSGRFGLTSLKLFAIFLQPTVSYKINDRVGIGAGFVYSFGNIDLQKDIPLVDAGGNYGKAELKGKASGYGFNFGLHVQASEKVSVAFAYRSQVNMKVAKGTATFIVPAALATNFPSGNFTSSLPLPSVVTLGYGFYPNEKLTIAFDINFIGWGAYDTLAFDYETNTTALKDTKSPRMYRDTYALRLGAQYKATEKLSIRAGTNYEKTPIPDGYVTSEIPDANRLNFTAGIGFKVTDKFIVDASYTFVNLKKRKDTNIETNLSGTYKTYINVPGLALIYNF